MTTLRVWLSRVAALFWSDRRDAALDREIDAHLDRIAAEHVRRGMSINAARAAARRDFGGIEQIKEACRDQRGLRVLSIVATLAGLIPARRATKTDPLTALRCE